MTEEQIKEAFMRTFAGAGEIWFNYAVMYDTPFANKTPAQVAEEREYVEGWWDDFKQHLDDVIAGKPQ